MMINDDETLEKQLGRQPDGVTAIVSRCALGCPQVIQNYVLKDGKPFPTLYWLTCPLRVKAISRIEGRGWVEKVKHLIAADSKIEERLLAAHDDYRKRRRSAAAGFDHAILDTGIGGVHDIDGIKCLHAHYAHYLATGENPLGEMVEGLLAGIECERRCDIE